MEKDGERDKKSGLPLTQYAAGTRVQGETRIGRPDRPKISYGEPLELRAVACLIDGQKNSVTLHTSPSMACLLFWEGSLAIFPSDNRCDSTMPYGMAPLRSFRTQRIPCDSILRHVCRDNPNLGASDRLL